MPEPILKFLIPIASFFQVLSFAHIENENCFKRSRVIAQRTPSAFIPTKNLGALFSGH